MKNESINKKAILGLKEEYEYSLSLAEPLTDKYMEGKKIVYRRIIEDLEELLK